MKIVMDIPEKVYNRFCCGCRFPDEVEEGIIAITDGAPLPKGHWEWVQYDSNPNIGNWHCSECRTIIPHMPEETDNTPIYKWCPMCGANMVESEV